MPIPPKEVPAGGWLTGVYLIFNINDGKVYVGSASKRSVEDRWKQHITHLRTRKHGNRYLQRAWEKHGEDAFRFMVLERCQPDFCIRIEQQYINEYDSANNEKGYNISPTAGNCRGVTHSEDVRKRVGEGVKKAFENPETRERQRVAHIAAVTTPEYRAKQSVLSTGRTHSEETLEKMRNSNTEEVRRRKGSASRGKPKSESTKQKMRKPKPVESLPNYVTGAKKGWAIRRMNQSETRSIEFNGETRDVSEWAELTGLPVRIIFGRLRRGWLVEDALSIPKMNRGPQPKR